MNELTAPEVARAAADLIEYNGHAKGAFVRTGNAMCVVGALKCVVAGDPLVVGAGVDAAIAPIRNALREHYAASYEAPPSMWVDPVFAWNDDPAREKWEVTDALRNVADKLEAGA